MDAAVTSMGETGAGGRRHQPDAAADKALRDGAMQRCAAFAANAQEANAAAAAATAAADARVEAARREGCIKTREAEQVRTNSC